MIGPLERRGLAGLGAAPEVPGLPRHDRRHAGHARRLAGVGDRIDRLRGRDDQHHVDLVGIDQRLGQLTGARRIGLGVAIEDFDAIGLVANLQPGGQRLAREFENIAVGLAEPAKLAGARADEADLERRLGARGESAVRAGGSREACGAGGHDQSAPRYRRASETGDGGSDVHAFPPVAPSERDAPLFLTHDCREPPSPSSGLALYFAIPSLSIFFHRLTGLSAGRLSRALICGSELPFWSSSLTLSRLCPSVCDFAVLNARSGHGFQDSMTEPRDESTVRV